MIIDKDNIHSQNYLGKLKIATISQVARVYDKKFSLPCTFMINHSDMCLVVDEVHSDLSQKGNGHIGVALYVCESSTFTQNKV